MACTQIQLFNIIISYNFMGKHAFWTASFQCLAKSLLATASLENEFHLQFPCGSHSTELSDFRQLAQRGNKRECEQTLKNACKSNEVLTNVISVNQHFTSTFSMQLLILQG